MSKKQISFNVFEMNCITHLSPGLWRYPNDRALEYKNIEYWQDIAKIAEQGDRLRDDHIASKYRIGGKLSSININQRKSNVL